MANPLQPALDQCVFTSVPSRWWFAVFAVAAGVIFLNPVGYIGSGADDWQYFDAARCWVAHGPCLPHNHWQGRWPLIAPTAVAIALLGESRLSVSIAPLAASLACLVLLAQIGNRLFSPPTGWVAALILATTPIFALQMLDPSVEAIELFFLLLGLDILLRLKRTRGFVLPFLAGLSFAMAVQTRETALVAGPFAAVLLWKSVPAGHRAEIAVVGLSFGLPFLVEALVFYSSVGDPFWRRRLSIHHTLIPSTELNSPADRTHLPFFNLSNIANWRHQPGIQVHWAFDGLLNLLVNVKAGLSFAIAPVLLVVYRARIHLEEYKLCALLLVLALCFASLLIYGLAIDPKPRMMFVPISACSLVLSFLMVRFWRTSSGIVMKATAAVVAIVELYVIFVEERPYLADNVAAAWVSAAPGQVETIELTRTSLAFVPQTGSLPEIGSGAPLLLLRVGKGCSSWLDHVGLGQSTLEVIKEKSLGYSAGSRFGRSGALCLFRYRKPASVEEVERAMEQGSERPMRGS